MAKTRLWHRRQIALVRPMIKRLKIKAILWGIIASIAMSGFYLLIMFLTMPSASEVWYKFSQFWYLISGIIIGFGSQIGLWVYIKNYHQAHHPSGALPGASGAFSGGAMVACCAHHLVDILPILGLSAATIFLAQYQKPFLIIGLSINLLGIAYMLSLLDKHKKIINQHINI